MSSGAVPLDDQHLYGLDPADATSLELHSHLRQLELSTQFLWQLRLYMENDNFFSPLFQLDDKKCSEMRDLREIVCNYTSENDEFHGQRFQIHFLKPFFDLWKILETLPAGHPLYVPPLYYDDNGELNGQLGDMTLSDYEANSSGMNFIYSLLKIAIQGLYFREMGQVSSNTNVGHVLLSGLTGVGKTTLLHALALGAAILLKRMVPLMWSYKDQNIFRKLPYPSPSDLVAEWVGYYDEEENRNKCGSMVQYSFEDLKSYSDKQVECVRKGMSTFESPSAICVSMIKGEKVKTHYKPFFCLDEFQELYVDKSSQLCKGICGMLYSLCRYNCTFSIVTGSTSQMKKYMFPENDGLLRVKGFPNFNYSIFKYYPISPLRTVESLKLYLKKRYPWWDLDESGQKRLLYFTGGIGRDIHHISLKVRLFPKSAKKSTALLSDIELIGQSMMLIPKDFPGSFIIAFSYFVIEHGDKLLLKKDHVPSCLSVNKADVINGLRKSDPNGNATQTFEDLVELGYLYSESHTECVQLSRPVLAKYYYDYLYGYPTEVLKRVHDLQIVRVMMEYDPAKDPDGFINAGKKFEALVRPEISRFLTYDDSSVSNLWYLSVREAEVEQGKLEEIMYVTQQDPTKGEYKVLTCDLLDDMDGAFVKWTNEIGLDGFIFEVEGDKVILHGWQCKSGANSSKITAGKLPQQCKNYKKRSSTSEVDDNILAGIIVKAFAGLHKLASALRNSLEEKRISQMKLTLTTNKEVSDNTWDNFKIRCPSLILDASISTAMDLPYLGYDIPISFQCYTGQGWVKKCCPQIEAESWLRDTYSWFRWT